MKLIIFQSHDYSFVDVTKSQKITMNYWSYYQSQCFHGQRGERTRRQCYSTSNELRGSSHKRDASVRPMSCYHVYFFFLFFCGQTAAATIFFSPLIFTSYHLVLFTLSSFCCYFYCIPILYYFPILFFQFFSQNFFPEF